ncbi:hypothetical protein LCGC14_1053690 [marine sediment metagenome]|uniref:B12-binding domain-containing protein n=1 Tax=marine sediment metagenome TaxID=412755 RepID=A0A0F9N9X0_9ZZZZ
MRIALLELPFSYCHCPSLSFATLKQVLMNNGIECDIHYLNIDFARAIGYDAYTLLTYYPAKPESEWFGTRAAFGSVDDWPVNHSNTLSKKLRLLSVRCALEKFFDQVAKMPWDKYDALGFTGVFGQLINSFAVGRKIKEQYPELPLIYGGPYFYGNSGKEYIKLPYVDVVFLGEAETSFPELLNRLDKMPLEQAAEVIPGIAYKVNDEIFSNDGYKLSNYADIPIPNYDDFILKQQKHEKFFDDNDVAVYYLIDISRGCAYGQCVFCDEPVLNQFRTRQRSPEQTIQYLYDVYERYPEAESFFTNASLITPKDIRQIWEPWSRLKPRYANLAIEANANLSRSQIRTLREAGVDQVQVGIESLIPECVKIMKKPHSVPQSIAFLKWCKLYKIFVKWLWLFEVPGQQPEWYNKEAIQLVYNCFHLQPPDISAIKGKRGTVYLKNPEEWGIDKISPEATLASMMPNYLDVNELSFIFDLDIAHSNPINQRKIAEIIKTEWKPSPQDYQEKEKIDYREAANIILHKRQLRFEEDHIYDSRMNKSKIIPIDSNDREILLAMDAPIILSDLIKKYPQSQNRIKELERKGLIYGYQNEYVSLIESIPDGEVL